jgi:Arc/MetJ-type ribon-helix-helix transcriptional regulator
MTEERKTISARVSDNLLRDFEDYCNKKEITTRSDAVRALIRHGLDQTPIDESVLAESSMDHTYPRERVLTDLRGLNRHLDRLPTATDMQKNLEVSQATVYKKFGSVPEAREAAGMPSKLSADHDSGRDPRERVQIDIPSESSAPSQQHPKERILTDVRCLNRHVDAEPSAQELMANLEAPSEIVYEKFGGWSEVKQAAGIIAGHSDPSDSREEYPTDRILTDLRCLNRHVDGEPSIDDIKENLEVSITTFYKQFQGVSEAKQAAGIYRGPTDKKDRILTDLRGLNRYLGRVPSTQDIKENLEVSLTSLYYLFGGIPEAREKAGIGSDRNRFSKPSTPPDQRN